MARPKMKSPVQIRERKLKNGGSSLYLDIYTEGKRMYESLNLYTVPDTTPKNRADNRRIWEIAEEIRRKRTIEIQEYGIVSQSQELVADVAKKMLNPKQYSIVVRLVTSINPKAKCADINKHFAKKIIAYLEEQNNMIDSSKRMYYRTFSTFVRKLVKEDMIPSFLLPDTPFHVVETRREFLTVEEMRLFANVETKTENEKQVKRMFLFCCLTGLRYVDAVQITYGDFEEMDGRLRLNFRQQKTRGVEYYDLSEQVRPWVGSGAKSDLVFPVSKNRLYNYGDLRLLVDRAKIDKHITFHCARHSFAILMISLGVDIYTTSKLLGHRSVSTTQIYARVLDESKRKAVDLIPKI